MTSHTIALTTIECCECGMPVGLSKTWVNHARELGHFKKQFYCPYCKTQQGWGVSKHEKEIESLRKRAESAEDEAVDQQLRAEQAEDERDHFRRSRDGVRGALAKVKNHIREKCPECEES